jgi:ribosome biogenesis protein ENP2
LLRPYMHGYFVDQKLYDEARLITNPTSWEEERAKRVQQKIDKERESRIRGKKKIEAKVNRKMVEKILDREEKNERRRAQRVLAQGGDANPGSTEPSATVPVEGEADAETKKPKLLGDSRFASLFQDADFEIDETSREFQNINPSTKVDAQAPRSNQDLERGLTAVEEEMLDEVPNSSASDGEDSDDDPFRKSKDKISTADYKRRDRSKKDRQKDSQRRRKLEMRVSNSNTSAKGGLQQRQQRMADQSFGARVLDMPARESRNGGAGGNNGKRDVVGDKMVTFEPTRKPQRSRFGQPAGDASNDNGRKSFRGGNDRRSASGNTFRRM